MPAFNDALDLKAAVGDHIGNRSVSDVWPRLVQMAETLLNQRLRTNWQVKDDTLTFTAGQADLPADFLEMIDVYGPCGYRMHAGLRSDTQRPGMSRSRYSIDGGKVFIRGYTGDKDILYYGVIPTISGSLSASNWLLERNGDVYLYAVGFEAAKFLKDVDLAQVSKTLLDEAIKSLKVDDDRQRWSNGIVRVAGLTP
ncbi:phage adaptor protein [Afipia carboxidovorans]|uniref:phage adaptor protein n=1 Tax=Afipia carboxidovorans TaxID=40137 RepID=UPI0030891D1C|nr:hypothetical protein CRBSH125_09510 [Afipia carboxidovorans]